MALGQVVVTLYVEMKQTMAKILAINTGISHLLEIKL